MCHRSPYRKRNERDSLYDGESGGEELACGLVRRANARTTVVEEITNTHIMISHNGGRITMSTITWEKRLRISIRMIVLRQMLRVDIR